MPPGTAFTMVEQPSNEVLAYCTVASPQPRATAASMAAWPRRRHRPCPCLMVHAIHWVFCLRRWGPRRRCCGAAAAVGGGEGGLRLRRQRPAGPAPATRKLPRRHRARRVVEWADGVHGRFWVVCTVVAPPGKGGTTQEGKPSLNHTAHGLVPKGADPGAFPGRGITPERGSTSSASWRRVLRA